MPGSIIIHISAAGADNQWWELVPAALGAILGAAAGAIPAFWLAKRSSNEVKSRDAADRELNARTAARTAMIKLLRISNGLYTLHKQVEASISEAEAAGMTGAALWQKLKPFGGISPEPVRFDVTELSVVFTANVAMLANEMMLISERYLSDEISLAEYSSRRRALGDLIGGKLKGAVGTFWGTEEDRRLYEPRMLELDQAATHLRRALADDLKMALRLIRELSAAMQTHFNDPMFLPIAIETPAPSQT